MKVVLVAMDKAPSNAFKELTKTLTSRGVTVAPFLGNGDKMPSDAAAIDEAIKDSDFVLAGVSSSPELAKDELSAIASAKKQHCVERNYQPQASKYMQHNKLGREPPRAK